MIHSSWLWEAPRSIASCCWATFRPETEATTPIRARIIAIRMLRRRRESVTTPDAVSTAIGWEVGGLLTVARFARLRYKTFSYYFVRDGIVLFVISPGAMVRHASQSSERETDGRIARTRSAVLRSATDLLMEGGPSAVTIDAIVARSGVAKSTIYRH